jgi:alanine racemase
VSDEFLVWAEVDLDAIADNAAAIRRHVGDEVALMAVVKANAYGHGALPVARAALEGGATWLVVNRVHEGAALRRAGLTAPILVMGYVPPAAAAAVVEHQLTPAVTALRLAQALSAASQAMGRPVTIHIKVDTGMGRFGLAPAEALGFAQALNRLPGLRLGGAFTHFATADAADSTYTAQQLSVFSQLRVAFTATGIQVPLWHAANSPAVLATPATHLDGVRVGIALYGLRASEEIEATLMLRPALTLKSRVGQVRTLPAGSSISYGRTYITARATPVALIQCGYGDGYLRLTSNRAPIRGRVCMDQLVVDISDVPGVQADDEAVLIGRQGDEVISAEEVAGWAETINYEVVTHLLPRVARIYRRHGQIVSVTDPG